MIKYQRNTQGKVTWLVDVKALLEEVKDYLPESATFYVFGDMINVNLSDRGFRIQLKDNLFYLFLSDEVFEVYSNKIVFFERLNSVVLRNAILVLAFNTSHIKEDEVVDIQEMFFDKIKALEIEINAYLK